MLCCPGGATPSGRSPGRSVGHLWCQVFDVCLEFDEGSRCAGRRESGVAAGDGPWGGCQAAVGTRALVMWPATIWSIRSRARASSGGALGRSGVIRGLRTWS
jgi:hypothetical protein